MSDNTFKKSPTAFLQNRLSMNRLIQNGSKKRIEKAIEYLNANDETATEKSAFIEINKNLNQQVDGNKAVIDGTCPVWNPDRFKSGAKLRVKTPGFRENSAEYEDAFYESVARSQGNLSSACGLNTSFVKTLKGEVLQLDSATFLKVNCGTTPTIYAQINPATYKFLTCNDMYSGNDYLTWSDGTNSYYTDTYEYGRDAVLYSNTALTTVAGVVRACYVPDVYDKPMLAGMFRSIELDDTVGQTNYCGWFYFGNNSYSEFTQVYTTKEKPDANDPIFLRDINTGNYVQFPTANIKVADWSAPATMFDVDYEFDYTPSLEADVLQGGAKLAATNDKIKIDEGPSVTPTHYHYNLRALLSGFYYDYPVSQITVTDGQETPTTLGTFNFDTLVVTSEKDYYARWENTNASAEQKYVYTWYRSVGAGDAAYSDSEFESWYGVISAVVISDTPEEYITYTAYAAPTGSYTRPRPLALGLTPDYTSADRREMVLEEYQGMDITPYITEKWWTTANLGYGEVSSQTTLYTETVFRYKDLDAHLSQYLPADWQGSAYGCIIVADSSAGDFANEEIFFGISHTDFFQDGSDVYYIIPTNIVGLAGENGPYDLIHAYVYDAALNSIYSTNFAIDSTSGGVTTTHHYISDATGNYQVGGSWRYHYACIEDKNQDLYAKRLAYDFGDLYYLSAEGEEMPLNPDTQTLVTPQLFPYATIYNDNNTSTSGICAWYDFVHMDITKTTGFNFTSTFRTPNISVTPTGGSAVAAHRSKINDRWIDGTYYFGWFTEGESSECVFTTTDNVSVNDTVYEETGLDPQTVTTWGAVTALNNVTRATWHVPGWDTTKTADDVTVDMYCWEFYVDPTYEEGGCWTLYTTDLVPTTASHLWKDEGGTWTDTGFTPASLITAPQTWYRYHTSVKETYYVDHEEHERFAVVWATSRNPYVKDVYLAHSNYDVNNQSVPTSPNTSNMIDFYVSHQTYIAPAYQMTVTYQGTDYTFTADYASGNPEFQGILYSGWACDDFKEVLYTARITPRVGDKLYTYEKGASAVAEGFVIKEVKSVVDFIYPGRA